MYIILVLNTDEDGDIFEEGLGEISRQILANIESPTLKTLLPSLFQRLSVYPHLNVEQRMGMIYQSDVKRMIIKRLREDLVISKSELAIWLKDQYKEGFVDTENLVSSLVQAGLVKVSSVKGITSDLLFLVQDLVMIRRPAVDLIKNPTEHHLPEALKGSFITETKNFFQSYVPEEKDCLNIIDKVLLNPQNYEVLKLLREAMVTRNDLEKLKKKGVDDVDLALKALWDNKMIAVFQDEHGLEYYCLTSDFHLERIFPRYNLNVIRKLYKNRTQNPNALLKALDLMREEYAVVQKANKAPAAETPAAKEGESEKEGAKAKSKAKAKPKAGDA
jgi:hypothetical protein